MNTAIRASDNFEAQLAALRPKLLRYAARHSYNLADAEDAVQNGMIRALHYRASFTPGTCLDGFAMLQLKRAMGDIRRDGARHGRRLAAWAVRADHIAADDPQRALECAEAFAAIKTMPAREATTLLAVGLGYTGAEAYAMTGGSAVCNRNTLGSKIAQRGRARLAEYAP